MIPGTTPVTIQSNHILRIAELLDYLADASEEADAMFEGKALDEHQRERISGRYWARELRESVARQKPATLGT